MKPKIHIQEVNKDNFNKLFLLAMDEYHRDKTKCLILLKECILISSDNSDIYYNLGTISSDLNNFDQSIKYLEKALEISPDNENIIYNLANQLFRIGDTNKSIIYYERIIESNLLAFDAIYNAGSIYLTINKNYPKAISLFERCIQINDTHLDSYFNLANSYYFDNNFKKARDTYEKIIMMDKNNFLAYYKLSIVYKYLFAKNESLIILKKYIELSKGIIGQDIYRQDALKRIIEIENS
ncbi:MAG: tetratricopeptide repeat protein [Candidatus Sericytochromatia bacterium]|nr:tetratricopeptide repeat protein [Candidatus Sericytochromatia bacterium]